MFCAAKFGCMRFNFKPQFIVLQILNLQFPPAIFSGSFTFKSILPIGTIRRVHMKNINNSIIATLVCAVIVPTTCFADLTQWRVEDGGNDHYYGMVVTPKQSWYASRDQAETMGGYLASIRSQSENDWIWNTFQIGSHEEYWSSYWDGPVFGAYRASETEQWTWTSGETWGWSNWAWGSGNGPHGAQFIAHGSGWDDLGANSGNYAGGNISFVIEFNSIPAPGAAALIALSGLLMRRRRA